MENQKQKSLTPNYVAKGELTQKLSDDIEITDEQLEEITKKQEENIKRAIEVKSRTSTFDNGKNVWRVIIRAKNDYMAYETKLMAMEIGDLGVLTQAVEDRGNKSSMAMQFIPDARLKKDENGKWVIL